MRVIVGSATGIIGSQIYLASVEGTAIGHTIDPRKLAAK